MEFLFGNEIIMSTSSARNAIMRKSPIIFITTQKGGKMMRNFHRLCSSTSHCCRGTLQRASTVNLDLRIYSYFKAVTGTSVAARRAGYNPDNNPITVAKARAKIGSQKGVEATLESGAPPFSEAWLA